MELIEADLTRPTLLVSSVCNLQECSGRQKFPDLPPAAGDGELRGSAHKHEGYERCVELARGNYSLGKQSDVPHFHAALAGKYALDFSALRRATDAVSTSERVADHLGKLRSASVSNANRASRWLSAKN